MQATIDQNHRLVSLPRFAAARATLAALGAALLATIGVIEH
jgi:hypothetical protein